MLIINFVVNLTVNWTVNLTVNSTVISSKSQLDFLVGFLKSYSYSQLFLGTKRPCEGHGEKDVYIQTPDRPHRGCYWYDDNEIVKSPAQLPTERYVSGEVLSNSLGNRNLESSSPNIIIVLMYIKVY